MQLYKLCHSSGLSIFKYIFCLYWLITVYVNGNVCMNILDNENMDYLVRKSNRARGKVIITSTLATTFLEISTFITRQFDFHNSKFRDIKVVISRYFKS